MSDRVEKFLEEFELAIEAAGRGSTTESTVKAALRRSRQLTDLLESLAESGLLASSVTPQNLRALHDELSAASQSSLPAPLIADAKALMRVVEDGIVGGDIERLRGALRRAEELDKATRRKPRARQPPLATAIRARCVDCSTIVAGQRSGGATNWNLVTRRVRDHERGNHGDDPTELRDDLASARQRLDSGDELVTAGRYELGQL
jgi:hypothetical protein